MSIDTASMDSAPSGSSSKNAFRVSVSLPGLPQMILPVSWSDTRVKYRWCLRQEISSTPMSTSPHSRSGSSTSTATRSQIAPTVRHEVRAKPATVVLSVLVASHVPGERPPLGPHAVLRAAKSPAPQHDPANPATHVQVPPRRVDLTRVVAVPCREPASRTRQPPPAQPDRHPQLAVDDGSLADPHTGQLQDSVQ